MDETWRLKPENPGRIRTTIQILEGNDWQDAFVGADASTTALMVRELNAYANAASALEDAVETLRFYAELDNDNGERARAYFAAHPEHAQEREA